MVEIIYIFNISLIIFYSVTMSFSLTNFLTSNDKKLKQLYFVMSIYFLFFILDNLVISMTEIFLPFSEKFNQTFMGVPFFKTIIFMINNWGQLWMINHLQNKKINSTGWTVLSLVLIWMIVAQILPHNAIQVYLYYLPNQLFLIYNAYISNEIVNKKHISKIASKYLHLLAIIFLIFGILIIIEDTLVIFYIDQYSVLETKIQNRNFCEDLYSIAMCILALNFFVKDIHILETETSNHQKEIKNFSQRKESFFNYFELTEREKEVCELMLNNQSNQRIADQLFLSIGTVKTHTHNIFLKTNTTGRNDLEYLFNHFEEK
ncbi:LuxR C-terminal-related transcriptional regulator [Ignavigranum ruoffiae]|uniref:LuxR C-terminal-related transcriptional regulator n=1 Tax=Ignavigranum ruoffiae TaxID=89093 RepID=UPI003AFF68E2